MFAFLSLAIQTEVAAGHANRTSVLFRPKRTLTTLLRCADSSKLRFP